MSMITSKSTARRASAAEMILKATSAEGEHQRHLQQIEKARAGAPITIGQDGEFHAGLLAPNGLTPPERGDRRAKSRWSRYRR